MISVIVVVNGPSGPSRLARARFLLSSFAIKSDRLTPLCLGESFFGAAATQPAVLTTVAVVRVFVLLFVVLVMIVVRVVVTRAG